MSREILFCDIVCRRLMLHRWVFSDAIWPYEFFGVNRSAAAEAAHPLAVGQNTFANVHFGHGNSAWRVNSAHKSLINQALPSFSAYPTANCGRLVRRPGRCGAWDGELLLGVCQSTGDGPGHL